jgi:hypothetical protein
MQPSRAAATSTTIVPQPLLSTGGGSGGGVGFEVLSAFFERHQDKMADLLKEQR